MDILTLLQLITFFICGITVWKLSYVIPMDDYTTKPVATFDQFYFIIAIGFIEIYSIYVAPWIGEKIIDLWPLIASSLEMAKKTIENQAVALRWVEFILVADFFGYFAHRFMHTKYAWRFHAIHHSSTSVNWLSGVKGTPIHYIVILTPTLLANYMFMNNLSFLPLFLFILFDMLNQQLCHSNVKIPFAKQFEYFFVTPRMHFVHHHPDIKYTDTNYGLYFSIWDRLFGTYTDADDVDKKGLLGLDYKESNWSAVFGLDKRIYPK